MRAQSWRRILGLCNGVLVLGVVGAGVWWFTKVRPAEAAGAKPAEWIPRAFSAYQKDAKDARPRPIWPVDEVALKEITHPDDWMNPPDKGGPYVWAYIGPPPPPRKSVEKPVEAKGPPPPSGLEVIGEPTTLFSVVDPENPDRPGPLVVTWKFKDAAVKTTVTIRRGEFFVPEPRKEGAKGRFRLKDGRRLEDTGLSKRTVELTYDVVDEATGKVERTETKSFTLGNDEPKVAMRTGTEPGTGGPGKTPDGRPIPPDDGKAPDLALVKIVVQQTSPSSRKVEFDELAWRYGSRTDMNRLLDDVKTKDVKDAKGNDAGVELTGVNEGSLASQFDVRPGDILKSINGTPVHNRAEAVDVVKKLPKDIANVQVVIERNGRSLTYDVDPRDPKVRGAAGKVRYDNRK